MLTLKQTLGAYEQDRSLRFSADLVGRQSTNNVEKEASEDMKVAEVNDEWQTRKCHGSVPKDADIET
ncbi:hypothetical protein O9993_16015 [Vibrio lentus]|nr:hypothetical protein [Vibrio lentus]